MPQDALTAVLLGVLLFEPACQSREPLPPGMGNASRVSAASRIPLTPLPSAAMDPVPSAAMDPVRSAAMGPVPSAAMGPVPSAATATALEGLGEGTVVPRVYIKNRFVFVRPRPDANADWLGFLWFGASVALRGGGPVRGPGCATFYAIEPKGFVCVDDKQATLSADDAVFDFVSPAAPRLERAAPHQYAESLGAALRATLPDSIEPVPALPAFFHEARRSLLPLSTVAYSREATSAGQSWLLTADLLWLRKTDVRLYPEITFHGVELGRELTLPLAFFRRSDSAKYRRTAAGKFEKSERLFGLHQVVSLRDESELQRGERYFQTMQGDDWIREREAVLPSPRSLTPWGARVGGQDHSGLAPKNARHTWVEVSVLGGWLLAYEGTTPVFATLISAGRGGIPQEGKNTLEIAATPLGTFPISGKLATVTMQAPGEYIHSEVPWTQNFQKPYAIHGAYWHDNWGNLQSGGCINVSPIDGKWLFNFTEPTLPSGWHAVRWQPADGAPTLLVVHE